VVDVKQQRQQNHQVLLTVAQALEHAPVAHPIEIEKTLFEPLELFPVEPAITMIEFNDV
jgi:hypothetical protein